ncbi:toprim domain-containing protein [Caudoviricetes sp.]|nr:toprim domain-containing protein [Caudoviricetes sp.]
MDFEREFLSHLATHGVIIKHIAINAGQPVRFGRTKSGWAYLKANEQGAVGTWGDWKTGESYTWYSNDRKKPLTDAEKAQWAERKREEERRRELEAQQKHEVARETASVMWGVGVYTPENKYALRKQITPFGSKQARDRKLMVPLFNQQGQLVNIQTIAPDGEKLFLYGGQIKGCFFGIGKVGKVTVVCEGYATGVSIHMATNLPVVVAFNAGNLPVVCEFFAGISKVKGVVVASDNDRSGTGIKKALECVQVAPRKVRVALCPHIGEGKGTDFNDLHVAHGLNAVKAVFDAVDLPIEAGGWFPSSPEMLADPTADDWARE